MKVAAMVLAAGEARRMGTAKQLLVWRGEPLVIRACRSAREAGCDPVVVVLGAHSERVRPLLTEPAVKRVENPAWSTGMGSSISAGVAALQAEAGSVEAVLLTLVDQPLVDALVLQRLLAAPRYPIIASAYAGTVGAPALIDRSLWPELSALSGAAGAKDVLRRDAARVFTVDVPEAEWDLDTPEAFASLP